MIHKYAEIFCWKNVSSFCSAKATHIFSAKNIIILLIEAAKTVNDALNNWALISIRIDILWPQLLLSFYTDQLETMHTCSTWSEDVHRVFGLSCHYLFFNFLLFSCDSMTWVTCGHNSFYSFIRNVLKLCRCFCHGLKICMCFWGYPLIIFLSFFPHFRHFQVRVSCRIDTLWAQLIL